MRKEFQEFFKPFTFLTMKDMSAFVSACSVIRAKKGEILIRAGEFNYNTFLNVNGYTRTYVVRADGEEVTTFLGGPGMPVGSSKTLFKDLPSNEYVEVLTNTVMLVLDFKKMNELRSEYSNLNRVYAHFMEKGFIEAIERLEFHGVMTAEQRYWFLLEERKDLIQHVPQKYIASYIGVTPVSLSRIRTRVTKGH